MSLEKDTNEKTMLIAPPPQRTRSGVPAAVELLGGFSELGLAPGEQSPAPSQLVKQPTDDVTEQVRLMEEARIAEMLFERAAPVLPEDAYYVSQAIGDSIRNWGFGRYVIDAGTGAGKTTAIMNLLKEIVASTPRYEAVERKRILYLCNRKALREQIIQAVFGDDCKRDFRDWDLIKWEMMDCLSFEFVDVMTYQKLQKDYQNDPEKTIEHIK